MLELNRWKYDKISLCNVSHSRRRRIKTSVNLQGAESGGAAAAESMRMGM